MVAKLKALIVIVGETASGKSDLAIKLAQKFKGEIINADSWTVYKGFDIGTAKPRPEDRELIAHHLIDIADPVLGFSAAEYKRMALKQIDDINKRGKLPIIVGGSGLYVDSVLYDYSFLPKSDAKLREKYNAMNLADLLKEVKILNYDTTGIDLNNKRRIIRLLENKGVRPKSGKLRKNTLIIGIKLPLDEIKDNITKRVDNMIVAGLEKEVRELSEIYGWDTEAMKGIGYREFKDYFEGSKSLDETKLSIINSSLHLAKKQRLWFKRNKSIHWVSNSGEIVEMVTTFLYNLCGK